MKQTQYFIARVLCAKPYYKLLGGTPLDSTRIATWEGSQKSLVLSFAYKINMVSVYILNPFNPMENKPFLNAVSTKYK
jgi:hypothetical protein